MLWSSQTKRKVIHDNFFIFHKISFNWFLCIYSAMDYRYNDIGSKISVQVVGPFRASTGFLSHHNITIEAQIGERHVTKYLNLDRSNSGHSQIDTVLIHNVESTPAQLNLSLKFKVNAQDAVSFQLYIDTHSFDTQIGAICGGLILICLNVLIISEVRYCFMHGIN